MATKTAIVNGEVLAVSALFDTYSAGVFTGVLVDFSSLNGLTFDLHLPSSGITGQVAGTITYTLVNIYDIRGSLGDDAFSIGSGSNFTLYASEGSDAYDMFGLSTLSYAGYATGLAFDMDAAGAVVTGKSGGNSDTLLSLAATLVLTGHNDSFFVDTANVIGSVDAGAGTDLLSFERVAAGAMVNLSTGTVSGISGSFSNFERLLGSAADDTFILSAAGSVASVDGGAHGSAGDLLSWSAFTGGATVDLANASGDGVTAFTNIERFEGSASDDAFSAAAGGDITSFTLLVTGGSDSYDLDGQGTLSYAGYATGLTFDMDASGALVVGKAGGNSDSLLSLPGALVLTGHDDSFFADAANPIASVDAGAGTDLLSFERVVAGALVNFSTQTASGITGSFSNFEHVLGSAADDTFILSAIGSVASIDGGDHGSIGDTLSWQAFTSGVTVDLFTASGDGVGNFSNIEVLKGTAQDDGFSAAAGGAITSFTILATEGADGYDLGGQGTLSYAGYATGLSFDMDVTAAAVSTKAGSAFDSLISLPGALVLTGHDDIFKADDDNAIGSVDAGAGTDTLDFSRVITGATVDFRTSTANGITGSFSGFERVLGSNADDIFILSSGTTLAHVDGDGHGSGGDLLSWAGFTGGATVDLANASGDGVTSFAYIENFQGSASDDAFSAAVGGDVTTFTILATAGSDSYDLNGLGWLSYADYATGLIFDMDVAGALVMGKAGGDSDSLLSLPDALILTGHDDSFYADDDNPIHFVEAGAGTDLLSFERVTTGATVLFTEQTGNGITGGFANFENVLGSAADDSFILSSIHAIDSIDGGDNGSIGDRLSWQAFSVGVTVDLGAASGDGVGSFSNIELFQGTDFDDSFSAASGGAVTSFTILATEGSDHYDLGLQGTLSYADYATGLLFNMQAGATAVTGKAGSESDTFLSLPGSMILTGQADTFRVDRDNMVNTVDAGAGIDLLSFANVLTGALVNFGSQTATGISGSFSNFENALGSSGADTFQVSEGQPIGLIDGGAGTDTLSFQFLTGGATVNLDNGTGNGITGSFANFEVFVGTYVADTFTASTATGFAIGGSGGNDTYNLNGHGTLSYAGTTSPLTFTLGAATSTISGKLGGAVDTINGAVPHIIGSDGNDHFLPAATGNETLDGGLGFDIVQLAGLRSTWTIINNHDGSGSVSKDGQTITLTNMEQLKFDDSNVSLGFKVEDDLYGVGRSATFWRAASGEVWLWNNNGTGSDEYTGQIGLIDLAWNVAGIGDMAGDGRADVVWHNSVTGDVWYWHMDGANIIEQGPVTTGGLPTFLDPTVWHSLGSRDFDGDGYSDLLWQANTGLVYEWSMQGSSVISQGSVANAPADIPLDGGGVTSFRVLGYGDVNGDTRSDVVWYNEVAGQIEFWFMNGHTKTVKSTGFDPGLSLKGVGDFNGDGIADLVGQDGSGNVRIATLGKTIAGVGNGNVASLDTVDTVASAWHISQVNDYNGDGMADILFISDAGDVWTWEMNGTTIIDQGSTGTINTAANWTLYS